MINDDEHFAKQFSKLIMIIVTKKKKKENYYN